MSAEAAHRCKRLARWQHVAGVHGRWSSGNLRRWNWGEDLQGARRGCGHFEDVKAPIQDQNLPVLLSVASWRCDKVLKSHVEAASGVPTASFGRRTANWCWFPVALQLWSSMRGGSGKPTVQMIQGPKGLPMSAGFRRSMSIFFGEQSCLGVPEDVPLSYSMGKYGKAQLLLD